MKQPISIVALALVAGCLAPAPKSPTAWNLEIDSDITASTIVVIPPYDAVRFSVLRPDGSVASDAYNVFSARPASLIRAAVAQDTDAPELVVRKLALDCRSTSERHAFVELQLRKSGKSLARAEGKAPATDGNYSKAFSAAFKTALDKLHGGVSR